MIKIVQSFWTRPIFDSNSKKQNFDRLKGGWIDHTSHFMSWTLSCLQLKSFYDEVELVTDNLGKRILIDVLKLPYSSVSLDLQQLRKTNHDLWALGKILAYKKQTKPFIHVDSDVYIWARLSNEIEQSELACQNFDADHIEYHRMLKMMEAKKFVVPQIIIDQKKLGGPVLSCNAGIFGGSNIDFFKRYTDLSLELVKNNHKKLGRSDAAAFNIIFEQYLFYCLAKRENVKISSIYQDFDYGFTPLQYVKFHKAPILNSYIHMIADFKKDPVLVGKMKQFLRWYHPDYYFKILTLIQSMSI